MFTGVFALRSVGTHAYNPHFVTSWFDIMLVDVDLDGTVEVLGEDIYDVRCDHCGLSGNSVDLYRWNGAEMTRVRFETLATGVGVEVGVGRGGGAGFGRDRVPSRLVGLPPAAWSGTAKANAPIARTRRPSGDSGPRAGRQLGSTPCSTMSTSTARSTFLGSETLPLCQRCPVTRRVVRLYRWTGGRLPAAPLEMLSAGGRRPRR